MAAADPRRLGIRRRGVLFALAALWTAPFGSARADQPKPDLAGWHQARWGMSEAELDAAFQPRLVRPKSALDFDELVVHELIPSERVAGRPFIVYFQLGRRNLRLEQVLLTYRGKRPTHGDYAAVARALIFELGPADATTTDRFYQSVPGFRIERRWRLPTTSVSLHFEEPNFDYGNNERGSLTLRYYPSSEEPTYR